MSMLRVSLHNLVTIRHLVSNGASYRFILWSIQGGKPVWALLVEDEEKLQGLLTNQRSKTVPTVKEVMSVRAALNVVSKLETEPDLFLPCKPDKDFAYSDDQLKLFKEFTDNLADNYSSYTE